MRRRTALIVALASTSALAFGGTKPIDPRGPILAGCDEGGSPLVKAQITLSKNTVGKCVAEVKPARMCVMQGGVVRWKVDNGCGLLEGEERPALAVTKLTDRETGKAADWLDASCSASLQRVEAGSPAKANVIHCDVPDEAPPGLYKYSLEGMIEPLDPELEVSRPPGTP